MSTIDTSDVTTLRRFNASTALERLREEPERWFTVRELADLTDLSRPTVSRVLEDLERAGWVLSVAGQPGGTGRPARRFCFNGEAGLVVSVDCGPTQLNAVVTDLAGTVLAELSHLIDPIAGQDDFTQAVGRVTNAAREAAGREGPVRAFALALPGPVSEAGVLRTSVHAPAWVGLDGSGVARELFPEATAVVGQDIEFATLAELVSGALHGVGSAVHVMITNQALSAIVVDGQVVTGAHGLAGARPQAHDHEPDSVRRAAGWASLPDFLPPHYPRQRISQVVESALAGDETDRAILAAYTESLVPRVRFLLRAISPELLLISGEATALGELIVAPFEAAAREAASLDLPGDDAPLGTTQVRLGFYPDQQAAPIGGVHAALQAMDWAV